jgi:hypothetical protein
MDRLEDVSTCEYCGESMYRMDVNVEPGEDGRRLVCSSESCWGEVTIGENGDLEWEC